MAAIDDSVLLERVRYSIATAQTLIAEAQHVSHTRQFIHENVRLNVERIQGCILLHRMEKEYGFLQLYLYR